MKESNISNIRTLFARYDSQRKYLELSLLHSRTREGSDDYKL
jgi:hypothetical protein